MSEQKQSFETSISQIDNMSASIFYKLYWGWYQKEGLAGELKTCPPAMAGRNAIYFGKQVVPEFIQEHCWTFTVAIDVVSEVNDDCEAFINLHSPEIIATLDRIKKWGDELDSRVDEYHAEFDKENL